ncbi:unnamed protein product [Spirodela intermedia]|uniref:Glycoside hydrolase family 31 TIM barrel domain-containing protein n=1 Tax=Spirodela intermedia TaxID=51605 RepID=A0A7I8JNM7_SPIIN|nr:unnamed protein product [Spirodela intermedia]CAA6671797.1 unnamed protein product [Spirodela intermedia]
MAAPLLLEVSKKHHRRVNNPDFLLNWSTHGGGVLSVAPGRSPAGPSGPPSPGRLSSPPPPPARWRRRAGAPSPSPTASSSSSAPTRPLTTSRRARKTPLLPPPRSVSGGAPRRRRPLRRRPQVARGAAPVGGRPAGVPCFPRLRRREFAPISSDEEEQDDGRRSPPPPREFNRVVITFSSDPEERIYGFGEQFSHMEFKGRRVPILVQEQGIGRGDQPITFAANLVSHRSGGDSSTTYAPSPFYMTSKMRAAYLEDHSYSVFDLTKPDRVQIQIYRDSARGRILEGKTPVELVERLTETVGRPPALPSWIISAVRRTWETLRALDVPIGAFWLQDWVGQRETIIGSQLWWNWELDADRYPRWPQLVDDLRAHGIRVMAYCNPCLAPTDGKPNRKRNLFKEADHLDILVKDGAGSTYMVPNTSFDVGMIDFTHPAAGDWFKKILQEMVDCGVRGWMADFGEGLPLDAKLFSGEDPISAHNRYPEMWAKVNREFVDSWSSTRRREEAGVAAEEEEDEDGLVFFMRAGFRDSPRWAMLFWEGDQMVSWQSNDGIKSSVVGLLSGGLSGFAFNHSDIGGYCSVNIPVVRYRRSEELLLRWMELNAFNTGNKPSSNCQFYSNHRTLAHFARFAKVYRAWRFYRVHLVKEASERGLPVLRHLFLHYPEDERVHSLTYQQFLVGTEIMGSGRLLPRGDGRPWRHIWSGRLFEDPSGCCLNPRRGFEARVEAPLGFPAVFVRHGSPVGEEFLKNLRDLNIT